MEKHRVNLSDHMKNGSVILFDLNYFGIFFLEILIVTPLTSFSKTPSETASYFFFDIDLEMLL